MRLAISNIAWDVAEDVAVAELLRRHDIDAIDVAPGKYFPDPATATESDIQAVRSAWADRGIQITGMQSLLFGTSGLNLFGPDEVQTAMLDHLRAICRIGAGLGATRLVFGSPKNRDRSGLSELQTQEVATEFFKRLGDVAASFGVIVCLEPNPPCYGANFMTDAAATAQVVERVSHPAIRMQLDTGALTINHEDAEAVLASYAQLVGHVHASEPELLPLGDGGTDHHAVFMALERHLPHHIVSIEMLATRNEPHLAAIERAVQVAARHYRSAKVSAE